MLAVLLVRALLGPHEERVAAAGLAHGHAVAHGEVGQVGVHGVALAVVAVLAALVLPDSQAPGGFFRV
jgi:hypothetical protein